MDGLPPQPAVELCVVAAGRKFGVHTDLIRAVMKTEGGRNGLKVKNKNGSYDLGIMQINTIHLPELKLYGITEKQLLNDACVNIAVGAWMLSKHIKGFDNADEFWTRVGNYNSKTPKYNSVYKQKVWVNLLKIRQASR